MRRDFQGALRWAGHGVALLAVWALGLGVGGWAAGRMRAGVVDDHTVVWLGQEQGLPSGGASVMVQAKDGFLWFGTFDGIARFDGMTFTVFNTGNTPELPSAGVANAHCDRSGTLWFSTYGGLVSQEGGRWRRHGPSEGWTSNYARTFAEGPDGTLYVTGFDGKVLRRVNGRFEEMPVVPDARSGGFGHCDAEGRFWVAKDGLLGFWDGGGWRRVEVSLGDGGWEKGDEELVDGLGAGSARDGSLWLIKHRLLLKVNAHGVARRVVLDEPVRTFWSLYEDVRGDVWVTTRDQGLCHIQVTPDGSAKEHGLGRVTIIRGAGGRGFRAVPFVAEDDDGNFWVGTASEGVSRWRPRLFGVAGKDQGLSHANLRSVAIDSRGVLWAAAYGGGVFRREASPEGDALFQPLDRWRTAEVESVLADRSGRMWALRLEEGGPIMRLDGGQVRVAYASATSGRISRWALHEDAHGVLWVGGPKETLSHKDGQWEQHAATGIRAFAEVGGDGGTWAGGRDGLYRIRDRKVERVRGGNGLAAGGVTSLHATPEGNLWIGTEGRGLWLRRPDGSSARLGEEHGVSMRVITLLYSDGLGMLWMGGDQGIACMPEADAVAVASGRRARVHVRLFGLEDGLPGNCHMLHARPPQVARTMDGRLWFPTSRGLVHVDPSKVPREMRPPRIRPAAVVHVDDDGVAHEAPWGFGGEMVFPPGTRSIRFHFAALSYAAPQRVVTRARLHRHGRLLAERVGSERLAAWDLLPPGDYALDLSAANEAGLWSPVENPVRFVVRPHLWQTTGFRLAAALSVLGSVVALAAYRVRHVRLEARLALAERDRLAAIDGARNAEALRQSEALRQKAEAEALWRRRREAVVRDVHDGIGGLASNLKMTLNLALRARDETSLGSLLQSMDAMVGETLVEVHGLMDTLESEVTTCGEMADEFRRHGNLMLAPHDIALTVTATRPEVRLPSDPRHFQGVFRIYKEAVANVVKHAHAKRVTVSLEGSPGGLRMIVADDGMGLPAERRRGRGLSNIHKRAAEMGGRILLGNHGGLRLTLEVPWPGASLETMGTPRTPVACGRAPEEVGA